MGVSVTPSSAQQIEWQVHPTVVSQAGSGAGVIGQTVSNFALTQTQFDSLIDGGGGLQPTIRIDCQNAGRTLIMPLAEFTGSATFQFQVLGWSFSRPADAWICQAITHSPTAVNATNTFDSGYGIVLDGITYKAFGLLGVTGERDELASTALLLARRLKQLTSIPILIGVGVSNAEQAAEAVTVADGVVQGASVMRRLLEDGPDAVGEYVAEVRAAIDRVPVAKG
jgi:hypothetical protein